MMRNPPFKPTWFAITALMLASHLSGMTPVEGSVTIDPPAMEIDLMVRQLAIYTLEVRGDRDLGDIDLKADGFRIQREIKTPEPNRRVFWIEPETFEPATIRGKIDVVTRAGAVLGSTAVTGIIRPYVKASPSRIFLGGLEYGTASEKIIEKSIRLTSPWPWKLSRATLSDVAGAEVEVRATDDTTTELVVRFSEDALKQGLPFGSFIERDIVIETDLPDQPMLRIPITAMLSINKSGRDFDKFLYKGHTRWQGRWATPNIAGAVMAPLMVLTLGYALLLLPSGRRQPLRWAACAGLLVAFGVAALLLARTYSRGGWVAAAVGLAILVVLARGQRKWAVGGLVAFGAIVAFQPAGLERTASGVAVGEDRSIGNRLLIWRGTIEMIADHPWTGVGVKGFAKAFDHRYRDHRIKSELTVAINDYLTFAAERGLPVVILALSAMAAVWLHACGLVRQSHHTWAVPWITVAGVLAVGSWFSSVEFIWEVRWAWGITWAALLGVASAGWKSHPLPRYSVVVSCAVVCATIAMSVGVLGAMRPVRFGMPLPIASGSFETVTNSAYPGIGRRRLGSVLLTERKPRDPAQLKKLLREAAHAGYACYHMSTPQYVPNAEAAIVSLLKLAEQQPGKIYAISDEAGSLALLRAISASKDSSYRIVPLIHASSVPSLLYGGDVARQLYASSNERVPDDYLSKLAEKVVGEGFRIKTLTQMGPI